MFSKDSHAVLDSTHVKDDKKILICPHWDKLVPALTYVSDKHVFRHRLEVNNTQEK